MTTVDTVYGPVRGTRLGPVTVWRGIPYAEPPVGARRFRPPEPPGPWHAVRDCTRFPARAMQPPGGLLGLAAPAQPARMSEDCLYLNVCSPAADADAGPRPVLVWIHGGGFILGSGSQPAGDGAAFARNGDVVVVTVNYRLGALGFLHLGEILGPDYARSGNCGLLDQIAALGWVRKNIAAFGGDPERVTVMGESAGAKSIGVLLATPAARGLFQRAISQSGGTETVHSPQAATELARALLAALDLGPSEAARLLELPAPAIVGAQARLTRGASVAGTWARRLGLLHRSWPQRAGSTGGLGALRPERVTHSGRPSPSALWHAVVDTQAAGAMWTWRPVVDGQVLARTPIEAVTEGAATGVALLAGSNRDEANLFALLDPASPDRVPRVLEEIFGARAGDVLAAYAARRPGASSRERDLAIMTAERYWIPSVRLAEHQARHAPVWMYRYDWAAPGLAGRLGAAHATELPLVWGLRTRSGPGGDPGDRLAGRMHAAWTSFVRGEPPRAEGLPDWPVYDETHRATMVFDACCRVVDDPDRAERLLWDGITWTHGTWS